jgi:hypothetical protein
MKAGQLITTEPGAHGVITNVTDKTVLIKWISHESGWDVALSEAPVPYPIRDIEHSLGSGFLTLAEAHDPNVLFLMRKHNVDS